MACGMCLLFLNKVHLVDSLYVIQLDVCPVGLAAPGDVMKNGSCNQQCTCNTSHATFCTAEGMCMVACVAYLLDCIEEHR